MKAEFSHEEKYLLDLLKDALGNKVHKNIADNDIQTDIMLVVSMARKHAILPFLYDISREQPLFNEHSMYIEKECRQIVMQSYRLLFLTKYVVGLLEESGIPAVVLKGVATASFYTVPELRKSGDIDLLIPDSVNRNKLEEIMEQAGFKVAEEQHANHHVVFVTPEGICIEIHVMLAEPFACKRINQAMQMQVKACWKHVQKSQVMGVELPMLDKPFHAYELLLHMLQHFMYAGFGLKLLCDWVMIWRQDWSAEEQQVFEALVAESGLEEFTKAVTAVCIKYLGLETVPVIEKFTVEEETTAELLREILDAEDFGNSDVNRMVMMNGTGPTAYIREFHHQMHLNFPRAGKCFLLWPVLWVITLIRFLQNNRKVRNTSTGKILKEAARRSKLMEELKIF